jgi:hypothetical protein
MWNLLTSKPVLIGLHLGFAIIGIDAFLWLLGKLRDKGQLSRAHARTAAVGLAGFVLSWLAGGYYYVTYYGKLVKPVILKSSASWAHTIAMEAKEHIFLFLIPLAGTVLLVTFLDDDGFKRLDIKKETVTLVALVAILGLTIGAMGFMISAAARWA